MKTISTHTRGLFQYLKGAIEGTRTQTVQRHSHEFQYLKGAIEGDATSAASSRAASFQYLKGAIEGC